MEDFIKFKNNCDENILLRKSAIIGIYEEEALGSVTVVTSNDGEYSSNEKFDSMVSKLTM